MSPDQTPAPDRIDPRKAIEPEQPSRSQPKSDFQSLMQNSPTPQAPTSQAQQTPAPASIANPLQQTGVPTVNSLLAQAANLQDSLGLVHEQLNTPNLKLKRSQGQLLKNKLTNANGFIRKAAGKLGVETPPMKAPKQSGLLSRLMANVDDGQQKLIAVQHHLDEMMGANKELRPAEMMLVQIKMGQAQQEIEYSSTMLSKIVDGLKQLFNIQL